MILFVSRQQVDNIPNKFLLPALFVSQKDTKKVLDIAQKMEIGAMKSGKIEFGKRQVIIEPLNITLDGESLKIR